MKRNFYIFIFLFSLLLNSCVSFKYRKNGLVNEKNYIRAIPFKYVNGIIILPVEIQNHQYNFMLDTGAELNVLSTSLSKKLDLKIVNKIIATSSSNKINRNTIIKIPSIKIGEIKFEDTYGLTMNISAISNVISCKKIDGIIGNNLMRKSNWQIDYKNKVILISDNAKNLTFSDNAKLIKMNAGKLGNIYLDLNINGIKNKFTFDTGYNGKVNTSKKEYIKNKKSFEFNGISSINLSGIIEGTSKYTLIESFSINDFDLKIKNPSYILVEESISSLLGNEFYENFKLTIDWQNDLLILDPIEKSDYSGENIFEVIISKDYSDNKVYVAGFFEESHLKDNIGLGTKILSINNVKFESLNCENLTIFWNTEWKEIKRTDKFNISIENKFGTKESFEVNRLAFP